MRVLAYLDGTLADPDTPQIRVDDLGLLRGDGIFETILVADGRPRELDAHLDRLARSAAMLDLTLPERSAWEGVCRTVIENWPGDGEIALKLVCTRGREGDPSGTPTAFALGQDVDPKILTARAEGLAVITLERGFDTDLPQRAPWLLLGAKTLSYAVNMAAVREAARRGVGDVIFTAPDGAVLEGPTSNVVIARGHTLYTPPKHIGILPGTTQSGAYRGAEAAGWATKVEPLTVPDLRAADGVFLTSSVRKFTRVHTLDGEPLRDSTELHTELAAAYESAYA